MKLTSKDIKPVTKADEILKDLLDNQEEDMEHYEPSYEDIDGECPECHSQKMMRYMRANGPDDYDYVYECKGCGATFDA